ncbi:MAG: hypothetical protein V4621_02420 [Pseudomonadota bacterium]
MQINGYAATDTLGIKTKTVQASAAGSPAKVKEETPAEKFLKFQAMSPGEKMRAAILGRMGLTEEQLASMPPEDRAKIEKQIEDEIKEAVKDRFAEKGVLINLAV